MATALLVFTCFLLHLTLGDIVNVALHRQASMSSYYGQGSLQAGGAVDGNSMAIWPNILATAVNQPSAWWKVDLQREVQNATVRIYFRTDYKSRRNGVKLYTYTSPFPESNPTSQGQLCDSVNGDPIGSDIPDVYSVTCPDRWRYLLLYTDTDNDGHGAILDFGELAVFACSDGTYGDGCTKTCSSRNCVTMTTTCERDGRCPDGCQSGWTGVDCTQACPRGTYGPNCTETCGECDGVCDRVDGRCPSGCLEGYSGVLCDVARATETNNIVGAVVGSVLGTFLVVVLLCVGVLMLLIRQGSLQLVTNSDDRKPAKGSRDRAPMTIVVTQHADVYEHAHTSSHVKKDSYR